MFDNHLTPIPYLTTILSPQPLITPTSTAATNASSSQPPLTPTPSHSYLAAANASSEVRKVFDNWLNKAIHRLREWSQAALAGMRSALEVARLQVHLHC